MQQWHKGRGLSSWHTRVGCCSCVGANGACADSSMSSSWAGCRNPVADPQASQCYYGQLCQREKGAGAAADCASWGNGSLPGLKCIAKCCWQLTNTSSSTKMPMKLHLQLPLASSALHRTQADRPCLGQFEIHRPKKQDASQATYASQRRAPRFISCHHCMPGDMSDCIQLWATNPLIPCPTCPGVVHERAGCTGTPLANLEVPLSS